MADYAREVLPVNLEDEMRQSYLDYAMSVIVGRALPDVRDGLKPVHRRVLYAMSELGNDWNKPYKKSARVVGDVIGKYHPHGDAAVYDSIVRMAQDFSMRYTLVDGQGNFGSVDGDAPAAMRYTEVRMAKVAHEMLADIDKETVDFTLNYDESEHEPVVFPTRFPNLLVNGSAGIAVGMATNIPPHNLTEIMNACIALVDDPELDSDGLMEHVPAPDFPTRGVINGVSGVREAYRTGRGRIYLRGRTHVEEISRDKEAIVVTELPYQVNKARLLEKIAELVKERKIEGITELRDESDKEGMRMIVELRRGENADVVLNNLYQHTQLETVFGINMVALTEGRPRTLSLKEILESFIRHRREVVTRRTIHDLRKARERAHVLEGLAVALANIEDVIALIRNSSGPAEAREALVERTWEPGMVTSMLERAGADATRPEDLSAEYGLGESGYRLSPEQAQAILDLRLHRLTGLEQDKIVKEYEQLLERIRDLSEILADPDRLMAVIRDELVAMRDSYGDERRTELVETRSDFSLEDLISEQDVVVTLSHQGYAKAQPADAYEAQRRGGRGKSATVAKDEDFVDRIFVANTHDTLLCFSSHGKVYWLKVYQLPQGGRGARGKPIVNLLPLAEDERISAVQAVRGYDPECHVLMATRAGTVKKTPLSEFSRPRSKGIIAIDLRDGDGLVDVAITGGSSEVMLFTNAGKGIRFGEGGVRPMGRTAAGVRGIRLGPDQRVVGVVVVDPEEAASRCVLSVTEHGYGKRTPIADFPVRGRGGQGIIAIRPSARNGEVVASIPVVAEDEIMLISNTGSLIRTQVEQIPVLGRNTQGVRLIRLGRDERLQGVERIVSLDDKDDDGDDDEA